MNRVGPRHLAIALERVQAELVPGTTLARVQAVWRDAVGDRVASEAVPVAERDGTITVACRSAVWAHELDLMASELIGRVSASLDAGRSAPGIRRLRFIVSAVDEACR